MKEFPQLYAKSSTGAIKTWQISVYENGGGTTRIVTKFGLLGGKIQEKVDVVKEGKNLGKANETTPYEQAVFNAQSDYNKKVDKKYITEIPNGDNEPDILLPMLALKFIDRKHNVSYPAFVQPKLNGVRCVARKVSETEIKFTTRKCKDFPTVITAHFVEPLLKIMEVGEIFDGEFYNHEWTFQKITKTVKKLRPWVKELEFHIFDVASPGHYINRGERLLKAKEANTAKCLKFVAAQLITHESEVKNWHDKYVADGYEGVIVRNKHGEYKFDHRSKDLQKYKEFIDEEFIIVGLADEQEIITDPVTQKETICVVFKCKLNIEQPGNDTFDVRPKGTVADRAEMHRNIKNLIGLPLTVRYQNLSDENKPIFPVGLAVRDYE